MLDFRKILKASGIALLIIGFACNSSMAQPKQKAVNTASTPIVNDTIPNADTLTDFSKKRIWMLGTTVGNNSSYLGRYQSARLPYYAVDLTYRSKTGFWASSIAYQVLNSTSFIDEVDVMAGWNMNLSKKIDASIYYSRFFFSADSELLKASVANAMNASAGLDWGYAYTRLNGSLLFGESTDFFLVLDNSRYFEIEKVLHKKDYLSFEPRISIIAGTQTFVQTHLVRNPSLIASPVKPPIGGKPGGGGGAAGPAAPEGEAQAQTSNSSFNIMTYDLSIPISYTYHKTTFEISGRYIIPVNLVEGDLSTPQLFLTASLYFAFY